MRRVDTAPPLHVLTGTTAGQVRGTREGEVCAFLGVPYARPPVGRFRFASPHPPNTWRGVRDATRHAPVFVQPGVPASAEDALYANVWTPDTTGSRPVLVYVHGGGWQVGGGSVPTVDGSRLAQRGDLVVVTFNYRLGVFGWGLHEDLEDPTTGSCANWGLQDQAALLRWVHDNAPAFGGDPANITVCGTSAGGASTWWYARRPELRGLVRRIVAISAMHPWQPAAALTPEDARTVLETIARRAGGTVAGLRAQPATALQQAWLEVFDGDPGDRVVHSGREYRGPVVDGHWVTGYDHELAVPPQPVMTIYTSGEGAFFTTPGSRSFPAAPPPPTGAESLREAVRYVLRKGLVRVTDEQVDACVDAYRAAAVAEGRPRDPHHLWTEVWGDGLFRHQIVRLAQRRARETSAPQYVMEFDHPVRPPYLGTPHDATSKFLFGTYPIPEHAAVFGAGQRERAVSETFMDLVASFASDGVPRCANAPDWPVFADGGPTTMILGGDRVARLAPVPRLRQLGFWDELGWITSG